MRQIYKDILVGLILSSFTFMPSAFAYAQTKKLTNSEMQTIIKEAENRDAQSQWLLGMMYRGSGVLGVKRDFKKSFYWPEKAARQGYVTFQQELE